MKTMYQLGVVKQTKERIRYKKMMETENENDRNLEREKMVNERGGKTKRSGEGDWAEELSYSLP